LDRPIDVLSGGQRQIIATLMALNSEEQILLLDEHTSALDPKMQATLMKYAESSIENMNLTTLMITHKMEDALKYGDRLIMLNQGNIVVDLEKDKKEKLSIYDLLDLFHKFEDKSLSREG
jgi:putative ABC transport system ATP-binding protein